MNTIRAFFSLLYHKLVTTIVNDTSSVLAEFKKLEAKIEGAIQNDMAKLGHLTNLSAAIEAAKRDTNAGIDAAYKLLHSVTELTK